jgi:sodium/pantothenate symporter
MTGITYPAALATFLVFLVILAGITIYSGRVMAGVKVREFVDDFYTAGRGLGALIVAIMVAAGLCSAGTFLGGPGLIWKLGGGFALVGVAQVFMNFYVLGEFGKKVGIVARRINAQSFVDIFMWRYEKNKIVVLVTVLAILIFIGAYASAQFVGGARILEVMTGFPYFWGLLLYGGIVVLYTTFGGVRGTALAILVQGAVMTLATLILIFAALHYTGGVRNTFDTILATNPKFITPAGSASLSPAYVASLWVTFGLVIAAMPHGFMSVLVYKSTKALHKAVLIGGALVILWTIGLTIMVGIAGKAAQPELAVPDHNLPLLAFASMPPALAGVVLAGVAGAIQSTVGVMLLVISSALVRNVYSAYIKPNSSPEHMRTVTRVVTAVVGVIVFASALAAPPALEFIIIFAIGGIASAFFAPLLGLYWPRGTQWGAVAAMLGGMAYYIMGKKFAPAIALGMDPIVMSVIVSFVLMIVVSLLTKKPSKETIQIFWGDRKP